MKQLFAIALLVLLGLTAYAQRAKSSVARTLEGVVVDTMDGARWMGIVVESGGRRYEVAIANNPDDHLKDPVVVGDVKKIGTRVKVTYKGSERFGGNEITLHASRIVALSDQASVISNRPQPARPTAYVVSITQSGRSYVAQIVGVGAIRVVAEPELLKYVTVTFNNPHDIMWVSCAPGHSLRNARSSTRNHVVTDPAIGAGLELLSGRRNNLTVTCEGPKP